VHVRLEVKQPDSNDAQEADSTAGIRPPKVTLVPDELLKKLAPVLITPIKAAGLPDLPATKDSLSSSCYPVSLWYKFLGDDLNAHTHDGAPTAWQVRVVSPSFKLVAMEQKGRIGRFGFGFGHGRRKHGPFEPSSISNRTGLATFCSRCGLCLLNTH
jgi:hypothetical protein